MCVCIFIDCMEEDHYQPQLPFIYILNYAKAMLALPMASYLYMQVKKNVHEPRTNQYFRSRGKAQREHIRIFKCIQYFISVKQLCNILYKYLNIEQLKRETNSNNHQHQKIPQHNQYNDASLPLYCENLWRVGTSISEETLIYLTEHSRSSIPLQPE